MERWKISMDIQMGSQWIGLILFLLRIFVLEATPQNHASEYCEFETMSASCQPDEVVVMDTARYGRMSLGRCVEADLGFVGCSMDVLDIADQLCSGRRSCDILVPNKSMKAKVTCLIKELTSYLTASFSCHRALAMDRASCRSCDFVQVHESSGIIASVVTKESKCGSAGCPWLITLPKGQRINMTLMDFGWGQSNAFAGRRHGSLDYNCPTVLATLKESGRGPKTVCAGEERETHVYISSTNSLEVRMVDRMHKPHYFLLKYEAIGCTDPMAPEGGWIQRTGEVVTVGCNESSATTQWICVNSQWDGNILECAKEWKSASASYVKVGGVSLSFGLSVTVIVVLALFIGLIILSVGLIIAKRRRARRHIEEPIYQPPPYMAPNYRDTPPSYDKTAGTHSKQSGPREENGYTHIWQRPLPDKPEDLARTMPRPESAYVQEPGSVHYGYNSIASIPRGPGKSTRRSHDATSFAMVTNKDSNRNNNVPTTTTIDGRYFQLDPDKMSNHVSA